MQNLPPIPKPEPQRVSTAVFMAEPAFCHQRDKYPSMSWGFMLYAIRWHFHRMSQVEMARLLGVKQEYISRWETGKGPVPQNIRTWLAMVLLERLKDGLELPLVVGLPMPSRNERQKTTMQQHGTFGGKGKKRPREAA